MLPDGKSVDVLPNSELVTGAKVADLELDDVFSSGPDSIEPFQATIIASDYRLTITYAKEFSACVVFTPPHREAICIEPYTCLPDGYNLEKRGLETGLRVLQPGGSFRSAIEYRVEELT